MQGRTITFFPACLVGQVTEFSTCPSGKTTCPGFAMSEESSSVFLFSVMDAGL